jgi:hypothetical protein
MNIFLSKHMETLEFIAVKKSVRNYFFAVCRIRIRIHQIHMFLSHPDPLVISQAKLVRKTLIPTVL